MGDRRDPPRLLPALRWDGAGSAGSSRGGQSQHPLPPRWRGGEHHGIASIHHPCPAWPPALPYLHQQPPPGAALPFSR
uniref:Uncharacterized protein n=1 Tax=Calidris pygmaea TaxID=425635 RepID=A0A8C3JPH2_9CHAR